MTDDPCMNPELARFLRVMESMRNTPSWKDRTPFEGYGDRCKVVKLGEPRGLGYETGTAPLSEQQLERAMRKCEDVTCRTWASASGEFHTSATREGRRAAAGLQGSDGARTASIAP